MHVTDRKNPAASRSPPSIVRPDKAVDTDPLIVAVHQLMNELWRLC